jgi:Domain of unknown function (DUF4111)
MTTEVAAYDAELVARLRRLLASELTGVYVGGSGALGDYVPGQSDLDRFAVCERRVTNERKRAIVDALRHESLPCPARGLEFVLYAKRTVTAPSRHAGFELNLNSGPAMPLHVSFDPRDEPRHWFVLDRAITSERGQALVGPPASRLFAAIPRAWALEALAESVRWHRENVADAQENAVLNACRAWRYAKDGTWSSKREAAEWALSRVPDPGLLEGAVARRHGRNPDELDRAAVEALLRRVMAVLAEAR